MKVLIVFNHPAPYKVKLFNEIAKFVDLDVIFERKSASDRPDSFYAENKYEFNHFFLKRGAFSYENSNTGELVTYLKKHHKEYDLIIMNGYSTITELRAIRYLNKNKIPFVLYVNGGVIKEENSFKRKFKTKVISSAWKYLSPSLAANEYLKFYGAKEEDILIYPYSTFFEKEIISAPLNEEEKQEIRDKYNLPKGKLFVSAAQFIERKNNEQLLSIFKDIEEQLLLIGSGPLKNKYLSYIEENNMKNVVILDFLERKPLFELLKACDVFITLSKQDIYGHTTTEALANGLPVISSNKVVSSLKLIKNDFNGRLVNLDNNDEIRDAISCVSYSMSKNAIEVAKENTIEKMAEAHKDIFLRLKQ